jgi:hypothetical protein
MKKHSPEAKIKDLLFMDSPKLVKLTFSIGGIIQFSNLILEKNGIYFEIRMHNSILDEKRNEKSVVILVNRVLDKQKAIEDISNLAKSRIEFGYKLIHSDIEF